MWLFKKSLTSLMLVSSLVSFSYCFAQSEAREKQIVAEAIQAIELCYHWGGEVGDQTEERNKEIAEGFERDCPNAKQKAEKARKLYPENSALAGGLLELIDIGYLTVQENEKATICETAYTEFERAYLKVKTEDLLFRAYCPKQALRLYGK